MDYTPPVGGAANDPYIDANPGGGIEGSAVPAAAIEDPQREIVDAITKAGLVPSAADLAQLEKAMRIFAGAASVVAQSRNLVINNNAVNPAFQIDIDADEIVLKDATGAPFLASAVNLTADITVIGADGLDVAPEAASTWYFIWGVYNPATTTLASLLSLSSAAPTLPAGYTFKGLLGALYNGAGSNFATTHQVGRRSYMPTTNAFSGIAAAVNNTYQSFSLATIIPPIAVSVFGTIGGSVNSTPAEMAVAGDAGGLGACHGCNTGSGAGIDGFFSTARFDLPLPTPQTIWWKSNNVPQIENRLSVSGYRI